MVGQLGQVGQAVESDKLYIYTYFFLRGEVGGDVGAAVVDGHSEE